MPTPERDLRHLLALRAVPGLGDATLAALLKRFSSAERAWSVWPSEWPRIAGVSVTAAGRDAAFAAADRAATELQRLGAVTTDLLQPDYPRPFWQLHDPPAACFLLGRRELLAATMVAVVGARAHTRWGAEAARLLSAQLAHAGLVVLSGLARGIDAAAHEAALAVGGPTVAVLGNGLDRRYPPEHAGLQAEIGQFGLLVSEFLPGDLPRPHHFPRRNRLIAALARGVLVVEAGAESGALITVDHALDLGRPVMAVPGPITSSTHQGSNRLIREGATFVLDLEDVIRCLRDDGWNGEGTVGSSVGPPASAGSDAGVPGSTDPGEPLGLAAAERKLWRSLEAEPRHIDDLCVRSGLTPGAALAALSNLEFRGLALRVPGSAAFTRGFRPV